MSVKKKIWPKVQKAAHKEHVTYQTVTFEGLNGLECWKWWQETPEKELGENILMECCSSLGDSDPSISYLKFQGYSAGND